MADLKKESKGKKEKEFKINKSIDKKGKCKGVVIGKSEKKVDLPVKENKSKKPDLKKNKTMVVSEVSPKRLTRRTIMKVENRLNKGK